MDFGDKLPRFTNKGILNKKKIGEDTKSVVTYSQDRQAMTSLYLKRLVMDDMISLKINEMLWNKLYKSYTLIYMHCLHACTLLLYARYCLLCAGWPVWSPLQQMALLFKNLPDDVLIFIFSFIQMTKRSGQLCYKSKLELRLVNRRWNWLLQTPKCHQHLTTLQIGVDCHYKSSANLLTNLNNTLNLRLTQVKYECSVAAILKKKKFSNWQIQISSNLLIINARNWRPWSSILPETRWWVFCWN